MMALFLWGLDYLMDGRYRKKPEEENQTENKPKVSKTYTVDYTEPLSWHTSYQRVFWLSIIFSAIVLFGFKVELFFTGVWLITGGVIGVAVMLVRTVQERTDHGCGFLLVFFSTGRDLAKLLLVTSIFILKVMLIFTGNELTNVNYSGDERFAYLENVISGKFELAPELCALLLLFSVVFYIVAKRLSRWMKSRPGQKLIFRNRGAWFLAKFMETRNESYLSKASNCYFQAADQLGLEACAGHYITLGRLRKVFEVVDTETAVLMIDRFCLNQSNQELYTEAVHTLESSENKSLANALAKLIINNHDQTLFYATLKVVFDPETNFKGDACEFWFILIDQLYFQNPETRIREKLISVLKKFDGFELGYALAKLISEPDQELFQAAVSTLKVLTQFEITKHQETMSSFLRDDRFLNLVSSNRINELLGKGLIP